MAHASSQTNRILAKILTIYEASKIIVIQIYNINK